MKSFFNLFKLSYEEVFGKKTSASITNLVITAVLIAVSMVIESMTIEIGVVKINFAFLAIAAIGMLMGPAVSFFAGGMCDIVGFMVHPSSAFIPVYVLFAACQGLIYGMLLYRRWGFGERGYPGKDNFFVFGVRLITARLLDILIINLVCNTAANLHYGFIQADSFPAALSVRIAKNLGELPADIVLMLLIMPAIMEAYRRIAGKYNRIERV